jgi:dTDP-4-dehydrorhamnose reductase
VNLPQNQTILITGAAGLLGPYLVRTFRALGDVVGIGRSAERADGRTGGRSGGTVLCDLTERDQTHAVVSKIAPILTIHCAAFTSVDGCEANPDEADRQNRLATANLVAALPKKSRLLFISTDQVYPDTAGPHEEGTESPVNQYGKSKLAGEREALKHGNAVAVRTNMFGPSLTPGRESLSDFVIKNLSMNVPTTLFRDLLFSPLHLQTLAACLGTLAASDYVGVCNLGSRDGISKAEFGLAVAAQKGLPLGQVSIGRSTQLPGRAPRARDLRMEVSRIEEILAARMPATLEEIGKL